jgi:hypothetical protein
MFCEQCKKLLTKKQQYQKQTYCSHNCYINHRKTKPLWFYKNPTQHQQKHAKLSKTKKYKRTNTPIKDEPQHQTMSWYGIYNKQQVEKMKKETSNNQ